MKIVGLNILTPSLMMLKPDSKRSVAIIALIIIFSGCYSTDPKHRLITDSSFDEQPKPVQHQFGDYSPLPGLVRKHLPNSETRTFSGDSLFYTYRIYQLTKSTLDGNQETIRKKVRIKIFNIPQSPAKPESTKSK